jgi:hypothetical protein
MRHDFPSASAETNLGNHRTNGMQLFTSIFNLPPVSISLTAKIPIQIYRMQRCGEENNPGHPSGTHSGFSCPQVRQYFQQTYKQENTNKNFIYFRW